MQIVIFLEQSAEKEKNCLCVSIAIRFNFYCNCNKVINLLHFIYIVLKLVINGYRKMGNIQMILFYISIGYALCHHVSRSKMTLEYFSNCFRNMWLLITLPKIIEYTKFYVFAIKNRMCSNEPHYTLETI